MRILAIETSCDETSIAIAEFSGHKQGPAIRVLSHIVLSQIPVHQKFGGVVPNLAKREHQKNLPPILLQTLKGGRFSISKSKFLISKQIQNSLNAKRSTLNAILEREPELLKQFKKRILPLKPPDIDAIAVTYGPGLAPALWVGVNFAKALAYLWKKPLIPVNHMAGHLYSAFLEKSGENSKFKIPAPQGRGSPNEIGRQNSKFPAVALLVSGGHTELVLMRGNGKFKVIGETLDDAAGEAFDKVARILGLPYPGGPEISRLASSYAASPHKMRPHKITVKLPRPMINSKDYNFSFSGLKTAVLYLVRDLKKSRLISRHMSRYRPAIAKEFQDAVVEVLVKKTIRASKEYKVKTILLGGGVAANKALRSALESGIRNQELKTQFHPCELALAGDNALMIVAAAYFAGKKIAWTKVQADANLRLTKQ